MSTDSEWKPQGQTIKDRAIETSRKLLEIGFTNSNVVERVVFQEIGRVLSPRLEQRIQAVPEEDVRGQLLKLRSWIDEILREEPQKKAGKRQGGTRKPKSRKGRQDKLGTTRISQAGRTAQAAKLSNPRLGRSAKIAPTLASQFSPEPSTLDPGREVAAPIHQSTVSKGADITLVSNQKQDCGANQRP